MKSEGSQHINRWHKPYIKTEFGVRCMEEIGTIRGLEKDDVANYILLPTRVTDKETGKEKTVSWSIHKLTKECDIDVNKDIVSLDNLEG